MKNVICFVMLLIGSSIAHAENSSVFQFELTSTGKGSLEKSLTITALLGERANQSRHETVPVVEPSVIIPELSRVASAFVIPVEVGVSVEVKPLGIENGEVVALLAVTDTSLTGNKRQKLGGNVFFMPTFTKGTLHRIVSVEVGKAKYVGTINKKKYYLSAL